jgi:hypothetical protein
VDTSGANAVYWLNRLHQRNDGLWLVSNVTERAKNKAEELQAAIEPNLVYPLLRGRDIGPWQATPVLWILVPQDCDAPDRGYPESALKLDYPRTYSYLARFRPHLERRAGYIKYLKAAGNPFYSLYDIKSYTFAPAKVVFREQAAVMSAAVITAYDDKVVIPDHKLVLVSCDSVDEAYYLAGAFNSSVAQYTVASYVIDVQMSTHVLEYVKFARFDGKDKVHRGLASLAEAAHEAKSAGNGEEVHAIERRIDELAAEMWGLSKAELKEIQESLAELK